jgi:hypothetical protein
MAVRLARVQVSNVVLEARMLLIRYSPKVRGVDAAPVPALVVDVVAVRDRPYKVFIDDSVCLRTLVARV